MTFENANCATGNCVCVCVYACICVCALKIEQNVKSFKKKAYEQCPIRVACTALSHSAEQTAIKNPSTQSITELSTDKQCQHPVINKGWYNL